MPKEQVELKEFCPLNIIVDLQISPEAKAQNYFMEVDYIKVYKPKSNDIANNFKSTNEFIFNDLFYEDNKAFSTSLQPVNNAPDAIASNKQS